MKNQFAIGFVSEIDGNKYYVGDRKKVEEIVEPFWKLMKNGDYSTYVTIYTYPTQERMIKELEFWRNGMSDKTLVINVVGSEKVVI